MKVVTIESISAKVCHDPNKLIQIWSILATKKSLVIHKSSPVSTACSLMQHVWEHV